MYIFLLHFKQRNFVIYFRINYDKNLDHARKIWCSNDPYSLAINLYKFALLIQVISCIITWDFWCFNGMEALRNILKWITIDMQNKRRLQNFKLPKIVVSKKLQASIKSKLLCFWVAFLCTPSLFKGLLLRFQFAVGWRLRFITLSVFLFLHIVHCDSLE
jgi:hypothetical protein